MGNRVPERQHILFLYSDTGGGHRSAAQAVIEALNSEYKECISTEMVDILKEYAPRPFNQLPTLYSRLASLQRAWDIGYRVSDGYYRSRLITAFSSLYSRRAARSLILRHPSDLIVSVHPLANGTILDALNGNRQKFIILVTDMVTTHAIWYHRNAHLCLVPSAQARKQALGYGLKPEQVKVVGLPVHERFLRSSMDRTNMRRRLGWPPDRKTVFITGGADGIGPIEKTAREIAFSCPTVSQVVITGRNMGLKKRLEKYIWPIPTFIYGFVDQIADLMSAADILVTKAGPGTISEALCLKLPMILFYRIPGQENGNVNFIVDEGAGVWAPDSHQVVGCIRDWLNNPDHYDRVVAACRSLAQPGAAHQIADVLAEQLGIENNDLLKEVNSG